MKSPIISFVFLYLFFLLQICQQNATSMLAISNLNAGDNIKNGLGFMLLSPSLKTLNFTLTSYTGLNQSPWMSISYPSTMTYANVSIIAKNIDQCNLYVKENEGNGNYECEFKVNTNITVDFMVKTSDQVINQFQSDLKGLCQQLGDNGFTLTTIQ